MATKNSAINQAVAAQLRAEAAAANITQLALVASTGITRSKMTRIFSGLNDIDAADFLVICDAIGVESGRVWAMAIERAGGEAAAVSDALASLNARGSSGDELSVKRKQKAAADMSVEELEGQRSAATIDPELDTDEPELP